MHDAEAAPLFEDLEPEVEDEPEVLVVGAGPVGLFAALLLAQRGVRVQIVDEERRPAARSYALALHPGSLTLLDEAGLTPDAVDPAHRLTSLAFYDGGEPRARLDFSVLPDPFPFVAVLPQQSLEGILESRLEELGVSVLWNHRLGSLRLKTAGPVAEVARLARTAGSGTPAVKESFTVRPRFVLGTDGHRSAVRHALAVEFPEVGPAEVFAVFEISSPADPGAEVRVVLDEGTSSVLWPIGRGRLRWSFQIPDWEGFVEPRFKSRRFADVGEEPFPYLIRERLVELLAQRAPWFGDSPGEIVWSMAVRFERRLAGRFGRDTVWLAGDAAHLASPIGNHSLNVGLREARELAARIARLLGGDAPADALDLQGQAAHAEWRALLGLRGRPVAGAEASPWVRKRAARIPSCVPASGRDLELLLEQIGLSLTPGR
jgi:2-polyprenyl-6-methoxyphenol hydroxylase-like FAD-dependent oxidoreductase